MKVNLYAKAKELAIVFTSVLFVYFVMHLLGITFCPIKGITGIPCPGCGMTTAWKGLLKGKGIAYAMKYNPLFWIVPTWIPVYVFWERMDKRFKDFILHINVFLFLGVWVYRMFFMDTCVIKIDIESGYFYKLLHFLFFQSE